MTGAAQGGRLGTTVGQTERGEPTKTDVHAGAPCAGSPPTKPRRAFGDDVVDHYVHRARIELEAFEGAVTDWEKFRGFERL